ncbi:MAG: AMIN domain-containing protein, partial [Deltaproteobacteria bacterium]|nr:AMIN domain-containing protein [Deltaproteobacteria bacterium]
VSETGMFLQTTHPYRVGDRVALRFDLEDNEVHVRAAEVMWVRSFEPISVDGRIPGVGVRFVTLDPPARAALRRLVREEVGGHRRGDTTLPDLASQAIPQQSLPATSLPPITQSMIARAGDTDIERTEEMLAMSLPPFTDPPRPTQRQASVDAVLAPPMMRAPTTHFSLPPDEPALDAEARVFATPAAITLGPKRASRPPSAPPQHERESIAEAPFEGWHFRKAPELCDDPAEREPPAKLGLSFDDDRPDSLLGHAGDDRSDSGPDEWALPASLAEREEPEAGAPAPAHSMEFRGAISVLPVSAERRTHRGRTSPKVLPLAAALLCSGALFGVGVGVISKRIERQAAPALAAAGTDSAAATAPGTSGDPAPAATPEPVRPVADVERALASVDVIAGAFPPMAAVKAEAPKAAPPKAEAPKAAAPKAEAPKAEAPKAAASKTVATKDAAVHPGSELELAVGDARVLKTFTLAGPHRIVVDLADATLPKNTMAPDRPGVTRVRFGAPAPGTSRVVVETEQAARQAKARVVDGKLIISFAS